MLKDVIILTFIAELYHMMQVLASEVENLCVPGRARVLMKENRLHSINCACGPILVM